MTVAPAIMTVATVLLGGYAFVDVPLFGVAFHPGDDYAAWSFGPGSKDKVLPEIAIAHHTPGLFVWFLAPDDFSEDAGGSFLEGLAISTNVDCLIG